MKPVEIAPNIHWVGVVDWECRDFHGYSRSPNGTTYNAFLLKDEKITLFDTVKGSHADEFLCSVAQALGGDLTKVDYLVVNHLEPDHAGAIVETVKRTQPEKIFCSPMGKTAMETIFHESKDWPVEVVKTGDTLNTGKNDLQFMETRMLHWPDNMMTYIPAAKMLISSDGFGQNWASTERFADEVDKPKLMELMRHYYANIVLPFSPIVQKTFEQLQKMDWEIDILAPDHGIMFRGQDVPMAIQAYADFAAQKPSNRAVILYDTMWHSTECMAHAIADGLKDSGVDVVVLNAKRDHHSRFMHEVSQSGAVVVGSPTHNNGILPMMAANLQYMKGLKPQNKVAGAFGSFGWSGESVKILTEWLTAMKLDVVDGVRIKNTPDHGGFKQCFEYGKQIAEQLKAKIEACQISE